jgi:toxin ParE1/3/4
MNVEWSEEAAGQLQAVRDFLARTSPAYAQLVAERIVQRTEQLADHPLIGAPVPEYADDTIREVFSHPYRIIYLVEQECVRVVAVIHAARQRPRNPPV